MSTTPMPAPRTNSGQTRIPDGFVLARVTDIFTNDTVPAGLLKAHRVAKGVWGLLVVHTGTVGFVFEDQSDQPISVQAGGSVVIAPGRRHHVVLEGPASFAVEFHREPDDSRAVLESTGLEP